MDLDKLKKMAVECMKDYIEHSQFSTEETEEQKKNYKHWADVTLEGIKQRLRDSDKLYDNSKSLFTVDNYVNELDCM